MTEILVTLAAAGKSLVSGDAEAAIAATDRLIRLGIRTPGAFLARAKALELGGQISAALESLLDAVVARPAQRELKLRALLFALDQGRHERAAELASFWLRLEPAQIHQPIFLRALQYLRPPFGYCEMKDDVLSGWVIGDISKSVEVEVDGAYAATECKKPTPELHALGLGDGFNGFSVRLPAWRRVVRVGVEGRSLWGSPFAQVNFPAMSPPLRTPESPKAVDIILPVYGGRDETLECIRSILSAGNSIAYRLIVVDDCSPDNQLVENLCELERQEKLVLVRRKINAGFIGAVQTVIDAARSAHHDIVLLNADTLVNGDWLDRLKQAAYTDRTIATATPLSNNAELLSYPEPHRSSRMPDSAELVILDEAARTNRPPPMTIPTGVGFCMYIRRDALHACGGFDEAFLVRGYAEENDFCIRAALQGWTNVVAPNVFVAHRGEVSFGPEKRWLAAHNVRRLKERYPDHDADYDRFLAKDPLAPARRSLQRRVLLPLLQGQSLTLVISEIDDLAWRLGESPEARLLISDRNVALEFRCITGLGRIDYAGVHGLDECDQDLHELEFHRVILCSKHPIAKRLAQCANPRTLPTDFIMKDDDELCTVPEGASPLRLLVPAPVNVEDFRALFNLSKQWQSHAILHRLIVIGRTFNDEQFEGLSNTYIAGPIEQSSLDRQGIIYFRHSVVERYGITGVALLKCTHTRNWVEIARRLKLPLFRLPEVNDFVPPQKNFVKPKTVARSEMNPFVGTLLGLDGLCLTGWAKNNELPGVPVVVELIADSLPIILVRADKIIYSLPNNDNSQVFECGFQCFLRPELVNNIRTISARIANTAHYLDGELDLATLTLPLSSMRSNSSPKETNDSIRPVNYVSNRGGLRLFGVAVDTMQPNRTLSVFAEYKGKRILETRADAWAPELNDVPGINAAHGFSLTLPGEFADGQRHLIHIVDEDGRALFGSPVIVCCTERTIDSWVHSLKTTKSDAQVLTQVLHMAQQHIPLSLDFSAYSDWKKRFGSSSVETVPGTVLVVFGWSSNNKQSLTTTLNSLFEQTHTDWIALLKGSGIDQDKRIRFVGDGLWKSTLEKLLGEADYVSVIEPGDVWHPHTLAHALSALQLQNADIAYSDCDFADAAQTAWFKPDWCPDTFLSQPLLHHGFLARSALLTDVIDDEAPSDWPWLAATVIGDISNRYAHVYHPHHTQARSIPLPSERTLKKVQERFNVKLGTTQESQRHLLIYPLRITYSEPAWPNVTLIVPTRDGIEFLEPCIESLLRTDYPEIDICIVDNGSTCEHTLSYLKSMSSRDVRVLSWPYPFNYSAINNFAVGYSNSEIIGLINNDVETIDPSWLKVMVTQLMRDGVGAVGAKLLWKNHMVQHAGVVLGLHGLAGHIGNNWLNTDPGYCGINQIVRSTSAVTAACLVIRRADYDQLGGLNENAFPVAFNDVDLCLRLRAIGKRIVWTPHARLIHAESATRGSDQLPEKRARLEREKANFFSRWGDELVNDPYYNPNLNLDQYSHTTLALPPRYL